MNRRDFLRLGAARQTAQQPPQRQPQAKAVTRNTNLTQQQLASRFLAQATFGATTTLIDEVANVGFEAWLESQFIAPQTRTLTYLYDVIDPIYRLEGGRLVDQYPFRWAWWQAVMTGQDLLRQRVAMALSEILVVSTKTDILPEFSNTLAYYYDILLTHAFGNYRDLLLDVTLSPAMGYYLTYAGNQKADPSRNQFPDENYAREVMQLFTIGLFELNLDGSRKKDGNGNDIPTYGNREIAEFAKIFTGLTYDALPWYYEEGIDLNSDEAFLSAELEGLYNGSVPLKMFPNFHEMGEKRLLNGRVIPANQDPMQDIRDALDNLFNHANVGPFIGRLLIQRLVKSNPSSAYIARVATAFNDNGSGVRGDMKAVVKAILLDDEARNPSYINDPTHGMLREPFVRYTQICRAFELRNENGENRFYNDGFDAQENLGQYPFASPSVFNFFSPDFKPLGPLQQANLNGPEFQITNSVSVIRTINYWNFSILDDYLMETPMGIEEPDSDFPDDTIPNVSHVEMNLDPYLAMEGDINALLDRLDLLLTYGTLSTEMRSIMQTNLSSLYQQEGDWGDVVRLAIILFMNCPDYVILK